MMKKLLLSLMLVTLVVPTVQAQDERPLKKGQNSINLYYGINLIRGIYKNVAPNDATVKVGGFGPVGIVYEHMVTDGIGLGAELGFGQTTVAWDYEDVDFFTNNIIDTYKYEYKFTTLRAMFRANFHFAKTTNFDAYFLVSAGYRRNTFSIETNDPFWGGGSISGFIPFGIKPGLGLRYFFTENIGIHMELAAGTPVACGGLSLRF